jgi:hypothetical protein
MNLKFNFYKEKQKDNSPPNKICVFCFLHVQVKFKYIFSEVIENIKTYVRKIC